MRVAAHVGCAVVLGTQVLKKAFPGKASDAEWGCW